MPMKVLYGASPEDVRGYDQARLRKAFLVEKLLDVDAVSFIYTHIDRLIIGGAVPVSKELKFGSGEDIGTPFLLSAREMGVANIGGEGSVEVDGESFTLGHCDILYIGRGAKKIVMCGVSPDSPPRFYMNSAPAGAHFPHRLIRKSESKPVELGETKRGNRRRLAMYIHPEVAPSCLLLMGITRVEDGSVWNTIPPHLHERRMEAYIYFDMADEDRVMHVMGRPEETRHLLVADGEAVLSPAWSIHMGCGSGPYSFVWGMTGENQEYNDVSPLTMKDLL